MHRGDVRARQLTATVAGLLGGLALCLTACASGAPASAAVPAPQHPVGPMAVLSGPITTGHIIEPETALPTGLAAHHYVEQEYFAAGTATAFRATSTPTDGRWRVVPDRRASYRTRIIVRRPSNPKSFNGTVVVEWLNVSGGESAPGWDYLNPELMRAGYAYVGVSAQALGVEGGTPLVGSPVASASQGLVTKEPARYGTLHHPGDQYALDIYAQIANALRRPTDSVLGPLHPTRVVAFGESQSAYYLTTFADAVQPVTHTFDGIFIQGRFGSGPGLGSAGTAVSDLRIRTDLTIPVFMFQSQTDVIFLDSVTARQPDTNLIRTWEVAGTAHADSYLLGSAASVIKCGASINDGPQHTVVQAAFADFTRWVDGGVAPPSPPPFKLASTQPPALALDVHGNVIGGVRTPAVDVPVSTLSGAAPPGASLICELFGSTTPFSRATLTGLYHDSTTYLSNYEASLDRAIAGGFILPADKAGLLAQARLVQISS
jgi:Alpha/beta hydrolase domain